MRHKSCKSVWIVIGLACVLCGCRIDDIPLGASKAQPSDTIKRDCLVTFFSGGNSTYYSRQTHTIVPSARTIRMTATEPGGTYIWSLSSDRFSSTVGPERKSPVAVINGRILTAILSAFTATLAPQDTSPPAGTETVNIDGQWYVSSPAPDISANATLFRRLDSGMVDLVWVSDQDAQSIVIARSYNMQPLDTTARILPGSIDILIADSPTTQPKRILRIDYRTPAVP